MRVSLRVTRCSLERGGLKPRPFHFRRWRPFAYAHAHLLKLTNHNSYFLIYYPRLSFKFAFVACYTNNNLTRTFRRWVVFVSEALVWLTISCQFDTHWALHTLVALWKKNLSKWNRKSNILPHQEKNIV